MLSSSLLSSPSRPNRQGEIGATFSGAAALCLHSVRIDYLGAFRQHGSQSIKIVPGSETSEIIKNITSKLYQITDFH
jgi:hypothetical protein